MIPYGGKELASAFRTVRKNTIQVAEDIPEQHYNHVPAPDCRSVARMLAHIVLAGDIPEEIHRRRRMTTFVGLNFLPMMEKMQAEEAKPRTKAEIIEMLRAQEKTFGDWLETLTPEFLAETVTQFDGATSKSRFEMIGSAKEHEMHHRGQLMLIERQLGVVPHLTRQNEERMAQMRAAKA